MVVTVHSTDRDLDSLVEIIKNWRKHGAGLEKRLEETAKKLRSSMRMKLTSLGLLVA